MHKKPEKPKNYERDLAIISILTFVIMAALFIFDAKGFYIILTPLWFYIITSGFWFRKYNAQKAQYHQQAREQNTQVNSSLEVKKASNVNQNIAKYEKLQREKKANAKWWQFWL